MFRKCAIIFTVFTSLIVSSCSVLICGTEKVAEAFNTITIQQEQLFNTVASNNNTQMALNVSNQGSSLLSQNLIVSIRHILNDALKPEQMNNILILLIIAILLFVPFFSVFLISKLRKRFDSELSNNKNYDSLTGARNYYKFIVDAERLIEKNENLNYAIVETNLKNFKYINERFGYEEGNSVLKHLADSIDSLINTSEIFARLNGDNFLILMEYQTKDNIPSRLTVLRNKIVNFEKAIKENYPINLVAGIYFVEYNEEGLSVKEMIERANMAQVSITNNSKLDFLFYQEQMRLNILRDNEIIKNMKKALENHEFHVYLQPQHYIQEDNVILSAEALVRWVKPDGRIIPPGDFIPIFEKNGFIVKLDRYVFEQVCKFIRATIEENEISNTSISVNVSRVDLFQHDFTDFYIEMKNSYNIPDGMIELEFTESIVFDDYDSFKEIMYDLKKAGFKCSLDDFGAGSSSLNVLKELPVDVLKMDKLFFNPPEDEQRNNSVIASVVAMARGLGMKIIAEGIEDVEQVNFLRKIGCDIVQGFIFSRPMPIENFSGYVENYIPIYPSELTEEQNILMPPLDLTQQLDVKIFMFILKYINALVFEIDIDSSLLRMISLGKFKGIFPYISGDYSATLQKYADDYIHAEDKDIILTNFSLQSIISCFYRGDDEIHSEYRSKLSKDSNEYFPFSASVIKVQYESSNNIKAFLFINQTEEKNSSANSHN
ncbi:MAG TPA: bifunctional diguanylate cyclase/phosphodiesterase [Clostridiales bacterium]|nr:bifunctional diguanylate cyclase/phosphodiesterase [Clostridiales bacterium]